MIPSLRVHVAALCDDSRSNGECDVTVLSGSLRLIDTEHAEALDALIDPERERAATIVHPTVGRRFVAGRAALRRLLARELECRPADVPLRTGPHGKPELATGDGLPPLHFSVAHSDDLLLVALSRGRPVGVDAERARDIANWERLAARVLDPADARAIEAAVRQGSDATGHFLTHWCRTEAVLKARGTGIAGLEAHRSGWRPPGLMVQSLDTIPLPVDLEPMRVYAAVAVCSPSGIERHTMVDARVMSAPSTRPASASTP